MALPLLNVEAIHPDLWIASQLGSAHGRTVTSGHEALDAVQPGRGWPAGALTEIIVPQPGCGELRLLRPALEAVATRPIFVLQPPHRLQPAAFTWWGVGAENIRALPRPRTACGQRSRSFALEPLARCCSGSSRYARRRCAACTWPRSARIHCCSCFAPPSRRIRRRPHRCVSRLKPCPMA